MDENQIDLICGALLIAWCLIPILIVEWLCHSCDIIVGAALQ